METLSGSGRFPKQSGQAGMPVLQKTKTPAHRSVGVFALTRIYLALVDNIAGSGRWDLAKTIDAREPVFIKWRINYPVVSRSMIEAFFIGYDADVREIAEENQIAKLKLLLRSGSREARPEGSCASTFKVDPH
jgi:hypothetical protein